LSQIVAVHAVLKFPANIMRNACTVHCVCYKAKREGERDRERESARWTFITGGRGTSARGQ